MLAHVSAEEEVSVTVLDGIKGNDGYKEAVLQVLVALDDVADFPAVKLCGGPTAIHRPAGE